MLVKRCGARVCRAPPWSTLGFQTRFLVGTGGRYYPTAIREHTQDFHKNPTRITDDFHKNYPRIPQEIHKNPTRIPQDHSTENSRNNFRFPCENTRIRMSHWENT